MDYWLGATDESEEGNWKWVTGEEWSYNNWSSGQPDDNRASDYIVGEDYLQMWKDGTWNDSIIDNTDESGNDEVGGFVCEWETTDELEFGTITTSYKKSDSCEVPLSIDWHLNSLIDIGEENKSLALLGLLLSDEQVEVLERYNINYSSCLSNTELLYKIDSVLNEVDDYELECVAQELAERNYYVNTNK